MTDPLDDPDNPMWDRLSVVYGRLSEERPLDSDEGEEGDDDDA
jgi:hypothetical protein